MDLVVVLAWATIAMLALSLSLRIVRWLHRDPDKRDLGLGDLLVSNQPLDRAMSTLSHNARRTATRYLIGSLCITILLVTITTLVLVLQRAPDKGALLVANSVLWCGFGSVMFTVLMVQLAVTMRKARRALATRRADD